jgi:Leucine rich repeat
VHPLITQQNKINTKMSSSPSAVDPPGDGLVTTAPRRGTDTVADRRFKHDPVSRRGDEEEGRQQEPYSTSSEPWAAVPLAEATPVAATSNNEEKLQLQKEKLEVQLELEQQRVANLQRGSSLPPLASTIGSASMSSLSSKKKRWIALGIVVTAVVVVLAVVIATVTGGSPKPTRDEDILSYINSITLSNQTLSYPPSTGTAEERAVQWLIQDDLNTNTEDKNALRQRYALTTLWFLQTPTPFGTDGSHSDTWTSNLNECGWLDVECDGDEQVTALTLSEKNVRGRIPNDLGLLTSMTSLQLWGNKMTDTIPSSLVAMTDLVSLGLDSNLLAGTIPSSLGTLTALTDLSLSGNQLIGTIPSSLGALTALTSLQLWDNQLIGTIPSSLGALTVLTALDLSDNQIVGTIPSSFVALVALTRLELYNNELNGTLPVCGLDWTFETLVTDCAKVSCPCCTHCCPTTSENGSIPVYEFCDGGS